MATEGAKTSLQGYAEIAFFAFSSIFLQKFGLTMGVASLGLNAVILWGVLLWLLLRRNAAVDPLRMCLFVTLSGVALCSLLIGMSLGESIKSLPSLLIFLAMYVTLLVRIDTDRASLLRYLSPFQTGMLWIAGIVIAQQLLQYTVGHKYWPNLDKVVPNGLLIHGYAYLRPYSWNSPYLTPNGIFFMEPSAASQFLALALVAEVIWFKRLVRMAVLAVGLLVGMAGTGPTVVALLSPLILWKMDRRLLKWLLRLGLPLVVLVGVSGAVPHLLQRSTEFTNDNSSAYARIILPFQDTVRLVTDPAYLISGEGSGSSPRGNNRVQWPISKLTYEYGLLTALVFHAFVLVSVLGSAPSRTVAMVILIPHFLFGGGFVGHTNIMMLVLFGSLFRLRPDPRGAAIPVARRPAFTRRPVPVAPVQARATVPQGRPFGVGPARGL